MSDSRPSGQYGLSVFSVLIAVLGTLLLYSIFKSTNRKHDKPLPPGPTPKPLIGNLLDMPDGARAQTYYTKLGEKYGPISSLSIFGTTLVVVNDYDIARELFDKRANTFSNRPHMPMLGDLMGLDKAIVLTQPGDRFNRMRRIVHAQLGSVAAVARWADQVDVEVRRYLLRTLEQPSQVMEHLRVQAAVVILKILYGYDADQGDSLIKLGQEFTDCVIRAGVPGEYLVDAMPIMKYIPAWFPGAKFQRQAQAWAKIVSAVNYQPFEYTKQQVARGTAPLSAVSQALLAGKESDSDISWAATSMLGGGADTTLGAMEMFYLAMTFYPHVLVKAQREVDSVVGNHRLVNESDRSSLPYTEAMLKEVMRWEPLFEVNIPHCAAQDDYYEGYLIPKGAVMLENICGFMQDESAYKDAKDFKPERFLGDKPEMDPFDLIWGHGRRICPGRHLAYYTLWLELSRTIQVFNIKPIPGREPVRKFTWGVLRRPLPFQVDIKVRSPEHEVLVRSVEKEHPLPSQK